MYTVESKTTYDEYGRALTSTNADGDTTTTAYTPATGAEPTSVTVTDPMGLATTTTYDPARGLPLTVTSPAGWVTTKTYDALGRLTAVWLPGHPTSGPADYTFSYQVSDTAPSVVTTDTLEPAGNYLVSETLYDSLGRERETQTATGNGNRDITDTVYNSDGWKSLVSHSYYAGSPPSTTLVAAQSSQVPSQTGYTYDGAGRVVAKTAYSLSVQKWQTTTSYGGDYTTVTPPAGGTPQTTYTNGLGQITYIYQYHSAPPATPPAPGSGSASGWDQTAYTYTPAGKLATITGNAANTWSFTYNLAGDKTSQTTPDAGKTTWAYDAAGRLTSATNAAGKQVTWAYDADGRKTAAYDTTGGASPSSSGEIASWAYDSLAKGQLTSSTTYAGGAAYTTKVTGYDSYGLPTGTQTTIPATTLAGKLAGTYTQALTYEPTGQVATYTDSAAGGLPAETVTNTYTSAGQPESTTGASPYVTSLAYTGLGQPQEYYLGTSSEPAWITDSYTPQTGRPAIQAVYTGSAVTQVSNLNYTYDHYGLITSEANTPSGGPADTQCFTYDYLGRLTQAWAQGTSSCAATPSASAEGGAALYWDTYTYNSENDLTSVTSTPPTGTATTTTATYPAAGSPQPHAITSQATTSPAGTATTSYTYNTAGQTTKITSPAATQSLTWNATGQVATDTTTGTSPGTTTYIYTPSGSLLLQSGHGTITLYMGDEQVTENTTTGTVTGTRYYSTGGITIAARTSTGTLYYLAGNQQATMTLAINAATLTATHRYYTPYGSALGTPPATWPGNQGFTSGTTDPATGLVNLGAREYNPTTSSFTSPDPLLTPYNPTDLNPYAYAYDNPATNADPTGTLPNIQGGGCTGSVQACINQTSNGNGGNGGGAGSGSGSGGGAPLGAPAPGSFPHINNPTFTNPAPVLATTTRTITPHEAGTGIYGPGMNCAGPIELKLGACPGEIRGIKQGLQQSHVTGTQMLMALGLLIPGLDIADIIDMALIAADTADTAGAAAAAADAAGAAAPDAVSAADQSASIGERLAASCGGASFTADTKVLLASGLAVPIASLKAGQKVLATNVRTGKTQAEPVAAVLVHHDTDRYDLTVKTARGSAVIHTTSNHLFYDLTQHKWVKAAALRYGDHLRTSAHGASVAAVGGHMASHRDGWMWDLTIKSDHDFYIDVINTDVLVHNCDITFGHGARHLAGTGLDQGDVEAAINAQVSQGVTGASSTGSFWGRVVVDGQTIEYRAYTLPNGTINVGTYYVP